MNCNDKAGAKWYLGKRVAYVYKVKNTVNNTRYRCSWGKVINTHGHAGAVRVKFAHNITARAMGATVRIMLYPNKTV
jgi:large subunit ribosomal protein L35Ae